MAVLNFYKVTSLPSLLKPDSIYYVRVGQGYDQYVTNGVGDVVAYEANSKLGLESKVDKESGKQLSDENYTLEEKNKLASLENYDDSDIQAELDTKVDKVTGKGLSDENYTLAEKNKLSGIQAKATANATNAQLRDRTTHTGVQPISSVEGLQGALDEKVDKETGKSLISTTDIQKLSGIEAGAQVNLISVDNLTSDSTTRPLSANQGKVLKSLIDSINTILQSDDATLDELQEIVDFIKLNREDLDSLGISSIAGLEDALDGKQPLNSILTGTTASFTSALKTKLDSIAAQATKNATDAQLRARSSHTGTQAISTIEGLDTALDGKVDTTDTRLSNSREWTASVVSQSEAEAGTATTARKWTAQRVAQAISSLGLKIGTTASTAKAGNWLPTWANVTGKPTTFAPSAHTHSLSEVTDAGNLASLSTNASTSNFLRGDGTWVTPPNTNTTYSEISTAEIDTGTASTLRTISGRRMKYALDKKSDTGHGHAIGDVTGLQAAIDSKTNTSTQVIAGTGLLGGGSLAANRTLSVSYGTTAGTAAQGNDSRITGAMQKSDNLSDLTDIETAKDNLGLGNVDNTSDLDKPISTATQAAIDKIVSGIEESSIAEIHYNYLTGVTTNIGSGPNGVHINMRRCLVLDNGTVNYYLNEFDSNLKEDGTPADLTGADGQVMVEIPRFWCSVQTIGVLLKVKVSPSPLLGLELHPAFKSGDTEHNYIYVGAYNATVLNTALNSIVPGLNLANNTTRVDLAIDKLCSLSGGDNYIMVGLHLEEFRTLARNRGEGWQVWDYYTWQAIQILGYTELGTFNGQEALGNGNVSKGSYPPSSDNQEDSPHTLNGASNHLGNGSGATNDFMSYRGIENLWGQCWQYIDGVLANDYQTYVCDDPENYSSDLTSDYIPVGYLFDDYPSASYITEFQEIPDSVLLIPKTGSGNSGQFVGDGFWTGSGLRGAATGGGAGNGAICGFATISAGNFNSSRYRDRGCRLMYKK